MKINGKRLLLYIEVNGTPTLVGGARSHTLTLNGEAIDVTTKDSDGWRELLPGLKSWSISVEGLSDFSHTYGFVNLKAALKAGTVVTLRSSTQTNGEEYEEGTAIVTACEEGSPNEDGVTYSATLEGSGPLTTATYPS